ncbi:uncharacterized protein [Triticum aestivum]|uniref:uncharacterized protein n=1 Tax=Triticum aestivum TaxID=4565 RepID=UPI001D02E751|nr:uncharacterized protein LOC123182878 [Triticum aestivum]
MDHNLKVDLHCRFCSWLIDSTLKKTLKPHSGLVWLQGIPGGSPLFPLVREPRAGLAQGNRDGHLDRILRGLTLPDPRPYHGKESHDPTGRGGKPRLERQTSERRAVDQDPLPPPPTAEATPPDPSLRCSGSNILPSSDGDGPRPSLSSFPGSPLHLEAPTPFGDHDGDGFVVVFYLLRSRK